MEGLVCKHARLQLSTPWPTTMARYYFNARGPNRHIPDCDGLDVSDLMTACAIARLAAADVLARMDNSRHHPDWHFEITNEDGQTILTIPFSESPREPESGWA